MKKYGITPYLFGIVAFFMVMDLVFIIVAQTTFSGVYTENYYQKGIDFDKIHKQEIYDKELGWHAEINFNKDFNAISVVLLDGNGKAITGAKIYAKLISPVTEKYDQVLFLKEEKVGVYSSSFQPKSKGQMDVRIKAIYHGKEFIATERVLYK